MTANEKMEDFNNNFKSSIKRLEIKEKMELLKLEYENYIKQERKKGFLRMFLVMFPIIYALNVFQLYDNSFWNTVMSFSTLWKTLGLTGATMAFYAFLSFTDIRRYEDFFSTKTREINSFEFFKTVVEENYPNTDNETKSFLLKGLMDKSKFETFNNMYEKFNIGKTSVGQLKVIEIAQQEMEKTYNENGTTLKEGEALQYWLRNVG